MSQANLMILTTTFPDREKARKVAHEMVDGGLAVCAQVGDSIESFYRWQGELREEKEVRVTFKILGDRFDLFCGELKLTHPYEVPQLLAWPAAYTDSDYLDWARGKGKDQDTGNTSSHTREKGSTS